MKIGLNLPVAQRGITPAVLRALAQRAESLGFVELFLGEHVVLFDAPVDSYPGSDDGRAFFDATLPIPDPLVAHAYLAAATSSIRLATGVLLLPQRNPVYSAKHIATLDWISGGRVDVGVGLGWSSEEFDAVDVPFAARGARCDEYVAVLRSLWTQPVSEYEGAFYRLPACRQYPKPVQSPHPPVWIGGKSDAALDRVARLGDGWYAFDLSVAQLEERLRELRRRCEVHERPFDELAIVCGTYRFVPRSRDELEAYRALGVDQVVVSLTDPDVTKLEDEMSTLAGALIR
jgi:probable F420-dependent oxidoreductase